jgi:molybdopterin synthase catalytic subunit
MIKIISESFNIESEFEKIANSTSGAYSFFLGTVRSDIIADQRRINGVFLECYEDLAYQQLSQIRLKAIERWKLNGCVIIHRVGNLAVGEKIVLVLTSSSHRDDAIKSCEFIIDNLKIDAAFWKFNIIGSEQIPIQAKEKDRKKFLTWKDVVN